MDPYVAEQLKRYYDAEMQERASRPLGDRRVQGIADFISVACQEGRRSVLEVGCGAGRDGRQLMSAGLDYTGIDLSPQALRICRDLGLNALAGSATDLPFPADSFDTAWSMSTLMHLPGTGLTRALVELRRVVRAGGLVEIGVWGHTTNREWTSSGGRYFKHRTHSSLRAELESLGTILAFQTWDWFEDGGHYQWARIEVDPTA